MILVDIGNSGLRATRVADDRLFSSEKVYRLSWSASVASLRKAVPEQETEPDQRWCKLEDRSAFDWLVSQFKSHINDIWCVSCVQRIALEQLRASLNAAGSHADIKAVTYSDIPMPIDVEAPERTGIDRLLAAYGAIRFLNEAMPLIVVQAGTAVTVDYVDSKGTFRGGSIMPGLGLSLQLLAAGTDQLPWLGNHAVDLRPTLPGKNTEQAISAGVNAALVGGACHLVNRYRSEQHSGDEATVIVSGGDGRLLMPHIAKPAQLVEHLVLRGLSHLASNMRV
jgi:type III pantothenate kinase